MGVTAAVTAVTGNVTAVMVWPRGRDSCCHLCDGGHDDHNLIIMVMAFDDHDDQMVIKWRSCDRHTGHHAGTYFMDLHDIAVLVL